MFIEKQDKEQLQHYEQLLVTMGSLSGLFSNNPSPYLAPRLVENLFCKSFGANNLSRSDASADASKGDIGIGIKTFLDGNGRTLQKVAEFNAEYQLFKDLETESKILKIVELRNNRIESTKRIFGVDFLVYHCVTRKPNRILVFETPMESIDIQGAEIHGLVGNVILFDDGRSEYSFHVAKSTLYKRFYTSSPYVDIAVEILGDPFEVIQRALDTLRKIPEFAPIRLQNHVFLPLYSSRGGKKYVPPKSGLNQWNASGRPRSPDEVYVPVPAWIGKTFRDFFPPREQAFSLALPDRQTLSAKICQDEGKALMSNPNSALGEWLLRDIMALKQHELLTYDKLEGIGLDSVVIYKMSDSNFSIDFTRIGSYESFRTNLLGLEEEY